MIIKAVCMIHRRANRIFRSLKPESEYQRCPCCGRFVAEESDAPALFYNPITEFELLGPGIPLLFIFLQNTIIIVFMLISVVGIYSLVSNIIGKSCSNSDENCESDALNIISVSNKLLDTTSLTIQAELVLAQTLLWAFIYQLWLYRCRKTQIVVDQQIETPSDFAILINPIPQQIPEIHIRHMIFKRLKELNDIERENTNNLEIEKIIIPKKVKSYLANKRQQQKRYKEYINKGKGNFMFQQIQRDKQNSDVAIVIFAKSYSKDYFIPKTTVAQEIYKTISCCSKPSQFIVGKEYVDIDRAPQPDDIIWQNIDHTQRSIFWHKVLTVFVGMILLLIGGIIQYALARWQLSTSGVGQKFVSIFSSIVVSISNSLIRQFLMRLTSSQGNMTLTMYNRSANLKLCYFQFLNAGVFYTLANVLAVTPGDYKLTDGFSLNITTFMILNSIQPTLVMLLTDYFQIPNCFRRYFMKNGYFKYTQKEANQMYEYTDCSVPDKYSYVIKTVLLTFFYTPFVPVVALISFFGFILYYVSVKLLFRYCYKLPNNHSNQINIGANRILTICPLILNIGQLFIFYYRLQSLHQAVDINYEVICYVSLGISILFIFLPWEDINDKLFPLQSSLLEETYKGCLNSFQITYQQADPLFQSKTETRIHQRDIHFARKHNMGINQPPDSMKRFSQRKMLNSISERPKRRFSQK